VLTVGLRLCGVRERKGGVHGVSVGERFAAFASRNGAGTQVVYRTV
jgi:hypothetical protein